MARRNRAFCAAMLAITVSLASGCGSPLGNENKSSQGYSDSQMKLIVATEKNRYESVYTDQIWEVVIDEEGTTFQEYLIGEIRDFIWELKVTNLLADEYEITLNTQEKEWLQELATEYEEGLTEADHAYIQADSEEIVSLYAAYHRANQVVEELTKDVNLEISDSEARVIQVLEIRLSDQQAAGEVYDRVTAEGADFLSIAREVSEDKEIEKSVGRKERSTIYEQDVFALEQGEISPLIFDEGAYYIVKCVEDYDETATLERKQKLALQRKNRAFHKIFDEFAKQYPNSEDGAIWETLSFSDGADSTTTNFFELYQKKVIE